MTPPHPSADKSVALVTLGCTRNEVDSEELAGRLLAEGWRLVDDASEADVAVVNTCGFVEQAKKDSIDTLLEAADLKESWLREVLNYGHTLGHAVEQAEGYRRRHGEAVSIGMVFAAELALRAGRLSPEVVARHRSVLSSVGLPTTYSGAAFEDLLVAMRRDKKSRGSLLRFVVLEDVGRPVRLEGPDEAWLREAYEALAP